MTSINGMIPIHRTNFDREQWTTCHIGGLKRGTVFRLPGVDSPVVMGLRNQVDIPGYIPPFLNAESAGYLEGIAYREGTTAVEGFRLEAKTSVLTRCDLYYGDPE